jgi:excisionase family DNA binding protein
MGMDTAIKEAVRAVVKEEIAALKETLASTPSRRLTDEFWPVRKAAKVASVSPWTVREWVKLGRVRAYGSGRLLRLRRSEFELFLTNLGRTPMETVDTDRRAEEILARHRARR